MVIRSCNPDTQVVQAGASARAAMASYTGSLKPVWAAGDAVSKNAWVDSASLELTVSAWNTQLCFSSQVLDLQCALSLRKMFLDSYCNKGRSGLRELAA